MLSRPDSYREPSGSLKCFLTSRLSQAFAEATACKASHHSSLIPHLLPLAARRSPLNLNLYSTLIHLIASPTTILPDD